MAPGGPYSGFKVCPQCGQQAHPDAPRCARCGHAYRQTTSAPPTAGQPNPTQYFMPAAGMAPRAMDPNYLGELARRFNESRRLTLITFWVGLFCLWPLWIVTYIEYTKMRGIKDEVAMLGIDVSWWQMTYGCRDLI